jgi:membrane protein DedA with SNARE-associated domain
MEDVLLSHASYFGIALALILTGCGLPISEEIPIVLAGVWSCPPQGPLNPWGALAACVVGVFLGDIIIYSIGRHFGRGLLRRHHWWAAYMTPEREARVEGMIHRHGLKVLFVARFLPGIRAPIYMTVGILRMPFLRYLAMDLICVAIVVGGFFGLSYTFGRVIADWIHSAEVAAVIVVGSAAAAIGVYALVRYRRRKARPPATVDEEQPPRSNQATQQEQLVGKTGHLDHDP